MPRAGTYPPPRHRGGGRRRRWRVPSRGDAGSSGWCSRWAALATAGVLLAACTIGYFNWRLGQIRRINLDLVSAAAGQPQNYLIVGSDSRAGIARKDPNSGAFLDDPQYAGKNSSAGQRSDTIMILRIDPSKTTAELLSLPRDLYVPISGTDHKDKINAAFGLGQKTLIQTVQDQFDIVINHYAEVDFVGFQKLVDAINGVTLYFDKPMWDSHTGLNISTTGCHTLNGVQALAFARSRYLWYNTLGQPSVDTSSLRYLSNSQMQANGWQQDGTSDLGRISRQQLLIRTAIPLAEHKAFRNPATLNAIMRSVVDSVTLDTGLSTSDLLGLAERFKGFDEKSLVTYAFPTTPLTLNDANATQVLVPDTARAEPLLAKFRGGTTSAESAVTVRVLNASGVAQQAANVAGALDRVGFMIGGTGDASSEGIDGLETTQVRYDPADAVAAKLVVVAPERTGEARSDRRPHEGDGRGRDRQELHDRVDHDAKLTAAEQPTVSSTTTSGSTSSSSSSSVVGVVPQQDRSC